MSIFWVDQNDLILFYLFKLSDVLRNLNELSFVVKSIHIEVVRREQVATLTCIYCHLNVILVRGFTKLQNLLEIGRVHRFEVAKALYAGNWVPCYVYGKTIATHWDTSVENVFQRSEGPWDVLVVI